MGVYKVVLEKENKVIRERIPQSLHLIGRYVTPKAFGPLLSSALKVNIYIYIYIYISL